MKKNSFRLFVLTLIFFGISSLYSTPWGKDSDMAIWEKPKNPEQIEPCTTPILGWIAEKGIAFHKNVISPADGPRSHFFPNSSQYTLDAMRKYGFFVGFAMGCDRLMRENNDPWVYRTVVDPEKRSRKLNPVP